MYGGDKHLLELDLVLACKVAVEIKGLGCVSEEAQRIHVCASGVGEEGQEKFTAGPQKTPHALLRARAHAIHTKALLTSVLQVYALFLVSNASVLST